MAAYTGNFTGVDADRWLAYCEQTGQPLPDWAEEYLAAKATAAVVAKGESPHQDAISEPAATAVAVVEEAPKPRRRSTKTEAA